MMPILLNIETATEVSSVCLSKGEQILSLQESTVSMSHSQVTTLLIDACLKETGITFQEIDGVVVSKGPGSYTALRVGSSVAKGICYALNKPLIAIDTLEALAWASKQINKGDYYCPMIDARRKEVYMSFYNNKFACLKVPQPLVLDETTFSSETANGKTIVFSGNGSPKFKDMNKGENFVFSDVFCSAAYLVPLAVKSFEKKQFESLAYFQPTYLKPPNITIPKKKL